MTIGAIIRGAYQLSRFFSRKNRNSVSPRCELDNASRFRGEEDLKHGKHGGRRGRRGRKGRKGKGEMSNPTCHSGRVGRIRAVGEQPKTNLNAVRTHLRYRARDTLP